MKPDHLFSYTASALRRPLADLVVHLDAKYTKLEPELVEARKLVDGRKTRTSALITDAEVRAQRLVNDAVANRRDRLTAALWLAECKRIWRWRRFRLTATELSWLYQGKELGNAKA